MLSKRSLIFTFLAVFLAALIAGEAFYLYVPETPELSEGRSIVLTDSGFSPSRLVIRQGDTVTFSSERGEPFWPASDPHPTHGVFSEFDSRGPIASTSTWTFTFNKAGVWGLHDHLAPRFTGKIVVLTLDGTLVREDCRADSESPKCFEEDVTSVLKQKGLNAAFERMAILYDEKPAFRESCHSYAHILGDAAFDLFEKGELNSLSSKTSYCGYGFYHGFMEKMLQTSGNIVEAQAFCKKAGELLFRDTSDAEGACYHGIGHGSVDGTDPTAWGSAEKMIEPGIKLCEKVAPDNDYQGKRYRCVTGVFNAIEILSQDPKYKLESMVNDPFYLCPKQPVEYQEGCYTNMLPALMRKTKDSFPESIKIIARIPEGSEDEPIRSSVLASLTHEYVRENLDSVDFPASGIALCRSISESLRIPCIEGLSGGHMKYGAPGKEYIKAFAFCGLASLRQDERGACYGLIVPGLRNWYSAEKISSTICPLLESEYQGYCPNR